MTLREAILTMKKRLDGAYSDEEARAMIRVICEDVLQCDPVDVAMRIDQDVPSFAPARLDEITERLLKHEPIQYILGTARFHGHRFKVTPATLVPRPETEGLVDMIVDEWGEQTDVHVLDLGTGSGCIAISLARALRFAHVEAIDNSDAALAVARENARELHVTIDLDNADILNLGTPPTATLQVLVSNPPYVTMSERASIEPNVLNYEPAAALFVPDDDPLRYYKPIARYAALALVPEGRIYLEVNSKYATDVARLLTEAGLMAATTHVDSYGNLRYVTATQPR